MKEPIRPPWTPEQVATLNAFQHSGSGHPFTCGGEHTPGSPILVAREDGWHCSDPYGEGCDYRQDWAHASMADPDAWPKSPFGERHGPTPQEVSAAVRPPSTAPAAAAHPLVQGRCPACNGASLFLGSGGYVTCARLDCPDPSAADDLLHQGRPDDTTTRVFAALHQSAEQDVTRVIDLYERWLAAGPPPLGVPLARWWDAKLIELRTAISAPQTTGHVYLSTGCLHGDHAYCQNMTGLNGAKRPAQCKKCEAPCICGCHTARDEPARTIAKNPPASEESS